MKIRILYISYDGMLEPLGQSQVLAYLKRLTHSRQIHLISYEKYVDWENVTLRKKIEKEICDAGIMWHPLRYHKSPTTLATFWDINCGIFLGLWLILKCRLNILHARSYVPSAIAVILKKITGIKYIFDMRGFWVDERVDGNLWQAKSLIFQISKKFEKLFLLNADYVVSLTYAAVREMENFEYLKNKKTNFEVITTCTDLNLFNNEVEKRVRRKNEFTLGYVGSVSVSYSFDEVLKCFKFLQLSIANAQLLILNRGEHDYIRERLEFFDISPQSVILIETDHNGVIRNMKKMDAGIFFIKQVYSKIASAPTKLGEFLGCGVPCLSNVGVGDMEEIFIKENVGLVIQNFNEKSLQDAVTELISMSMDEGIKERCRNAALDYFSIDIAIEKYSNVYNHLVNN